MKCHNIDKIDTFDDYEPSIFDTGLTTISGSDGQELPMEACHDRDYYLYMEDKYTQNERM